MKKILFVDDSDTFQKIASHLASNYKVKAEQAFDSDTAIAMCELETYDIIFVDQRLPSLSGIDLIYFLSDKYPKTAFYLLTNYPKDTLNEDLKSLGTSLKGFINKHDLIDRLEEVLGGE